MAADLVLGPVLRYVDERRATVWVETDAPCRVSVLDADAATFTVHGRHYGLVVIDGLSPGADVAYEVRLDDRIVWPAPGDDWPAPRIRTRVGPDVRLAFGSCRTAKPLREPWTRPADEDARGLGTDALSAYAHRLRDLPREDWPELLLLLGDQVYADEVGPATRRFVRRRRDVARPPGDQVLDFEEYARLYRESWSEPSVRWLLSTLPTAMIFDDHDVIDAWNISASWVDAMRATDWWRERITAGFASYWVYQHLGNLSPDDLDADPLLARVRGADDGGGAIDELAERVDHDPTTIRWSFDRSLGDARLLVVDTRAARVLRPEQERDMLHEAEWRWLEEGVDTPARHLIVASSLPVLLPDSISAVESWNERLVAGAWGRRAARWSEQLRRMLDLEHWPAFWRSLRRLLGLLGAVADRTTPPVSITLLGGDVHHAYLARIRVGSSATPVHQVVASPFRQSIEPGIARLYRVGVSRLGRWGGRVAGRLVGPPDWTASELLTPPILDNHVATLDLRSDTVRATIETVVAPTDGAAATLRTAVRRRLA